MKKLLPIATTLLLATGLIIASCTKKNSNPVGNYTCHCSINASGTITTTDIPLNNTAKNTATTDCATAQTTYTNVAAGVSATCTLN